MSRRRRRVNGASHDRWLVSYADFITLLFAFFVVLYASSQVDKRKVGMLALAIQVAFQEMGVFQASTTEVPIDVARPMPFATAQAIENTERTASLARIASHPEGALGASLENGDLAKLQTELESALAGEIERREIALHREPDGLVISLREVGFFGSGEAEMKSTSQAAFDRIASILRRGDYRLRIEGHTDNTPIHNAKFPSNWELSAARATEIVRLLIVRDGFAPERLSAAGYAEYHPVASNRTIEGRGMNRRVDIVVLGQAVTESGSTPDGAQNPPTAPVNKQLPVDKTAKPSAMVAPAPDNGREVDGRLQQ
jgi:chemotaxis protein MotB